MKKNAKIFIFSFLFGLVLLGVLTLGLNKDNTMECRVIYKHFTSVDQECILKLSTDNKIWDIKPIYPMEDCFSGQWFELRYEIPREAWNIDSFAMELLHNEGEAVISSIEFYNHNLQVAKYSPQDIKRLFYSDRSTVNSDYAYITYTNSDDAFYLNGNSLLVSEYNSFSEVNLPAFLNILFYSLIGGIAFGVVYKYSFRDRCKKVVLKKKDRLILFGLIVIFSIACIMTFMAKHYSHCDEQLTRFGIDYFLGRWRLPDLDSSLLAGTYSFQYGGYTGHTRLEEVSLYYLIAAKVGWFFREYLNVKVYYRVLNLALFAMVLIIYWRKRNSCPWLIVPIVLTPQLWYIFSYATSDSWDWFWGFVILSLVSDKNSSLYTKVLNNDIKLFKKLPNMILYSVLFAQILVGKTNYLIVLAVVFLELLFILIKKKDEIGKILPIYLLILIMSFGIKFGMEYFPRQFEVTAYADAYNQLQEAAKERVAVRDGYFATRHTNNFKEQGVSFWDTMWNVSYMPAPALLFTSTIGYYVWSSLWGGTLYSTIMLMLYGVLGLTIVFNSIKSKDIVIITKVFSYIMMMALLFIVALVNCWIGPFQPQGRYMLPLFLVIGFILSYNKELLDKKLLRMLMISCAILGAWSFCYAGLYTMSKSCLLF